jgi:hypothetical protein
VYFYEEPQVLKNKLEVSWLGSFWFHTINKWDLELGFRCGSSSSSSQKRRRISHFGFSFEN